MAKVIDERGPVAEAVHKAGRDMRKQQAAGAVAMEGPTPERAARANGHMRLGQDGVFRIEDSVLAQLALRGDLAPPDASVAKDERKRINALFLAVGDRYFTHVYLSGLIPSGSLDPSRIKVDGGGHAGTRYFSESAADHIRWYRRSEKAMGPYLSCVVNPIVLMDEPVLNVGWRISGYRQAHAARAVTLDRLRQGLRLLSVEYSLQDS